MEQKNARFDVNKFNWIGSANSEVSLIVVWHTAPVKTIQDLQKSEITVGATGAAEGPIFRRVSRGGRVLDTGLSPQAIATVVKRAGEAAGIDPQRLGDHSFRAGFATMAATRGASPWAIMRHRITEGLKPYVRPDGVM